MKILGRLLLGILAILILALVVLRIVGLDPKDRRPGLWLKGDVTAAPADWSFTDKIRTVKLETHTWYMIPHSVTIDCNTIDGHLYLISVYAPGPERPWNRNVERDPNVRLKIGDNLYDLTLQEITEPVEKSAALASRTKKYPQLKIPPNPVTHVFRVM